MRKGGLYISHTLCAVRVAAARNKTLIKCVFPRLNTSLYSFAEFTIEEEHGKDSVLTHNVADDVKDIIPILPVNVKPLLLFAHLSE